VECVSTRSESPGRQAGVIVFHMCTVLIVFARYTFEYISAPTATAAARADGLRRATVIVNRARQHITCHIHGVHHHYI
jgi:hypothetical protein